MHSVSPILFRRRLSKFPFKNALLVICDNIRRPILGRSQGKKVEARGVEARSHQYKPHYLMWIIRVN